jgi:hypothetical protein
MLETNDFNVFRHYLSPITYGDYPRKMDEKYDKIIMN